MEFRKIIEIGVVGVMLFLVIMAAVNLIFVPFPQMLINIICILGITFVWHIVSFSVFSYFENKELNETGVKQKTTKGKL